MDGFSLTFTEVCNKILYYDSTYKILLLFSSEKVGCYQLVIFIGVKALYYVTYFTSCVPLNSIHFNPKLMSLQNVLPVSLKSLSFGFSKTHVCVEVCGSVWKCVWKCVEVCEVDLNTARSSLGGLEVQSGTPPHKGYYGYCVILRTPRAGAHDGGERGA